MLFYLGTRETYLGTLISYQVPMETENTLQTQLSPEVNLGSEGSYLSVAPGPGGLWFAPARAGIR